MFAVNATNVRNNWGEYVDKIVREKPIFIKRSRDCFMGISTSMMKELLKDIKFYCNSFIEEDHSYTLSLEDIDIVVNEKTYDKALDLLISDLREYALDYYEDLKYWYSSPNRKQHINYVIKVLLCESDEELKKDIVCQVGES